MTLLKMAFLQFRIDGSRSNQAILLGFKDFFPIVAPWFRWSTTLLEFKDFFICVVSLPVLGPIIAFMLTALSTDLFFVSKIMLDNEI